LFWSNDQSNFQPTCETLAMGACEVKNNEKSKTRTISLPKASKGILRAIRVPVVFAWPALLLLASPFSGTDTPVCALLLRGNPSDLGFHSASHPMNARDEAEAHLTKPNFLIANPELELNLSPTKTIRYNFLIANK
jgi:hypothetical protein